MQGEQCEQRPRARAPQLERLACLTCLEWTQERQLDEAPTSGGRFR